MEQTKKSIAKFKNNQDDAEGKLDMVTESYCLVNSGKRKI